MKWNKTEYQLLATKVYKAINQGRLAIQEGEALTAPQIIGTECWSTLDEAEQCFSYCFVSTAIQMGLLGLVQVGRNSNRLWLYSLE
jgi:hypothetical protein